MLKKILLLSVAVSIVLGVISACAVQGKIYPEGVTITGYDEGTDYLSPWRIVRVPTRLMH